MGSKQYFVKMLLIQNNYWVLNHWAVYSLKRTRIQSKNAAIQDIYNQFKVFKANKVRLYDKRLLDY